MVWTGLLTAVLLLVAEATTGVPGATGSTPWVAWVGAAVAAAVAAAVLVRLPVRPALSRCG
ncbi:hypothetical protein [Paractinoplanes hotanensis]|uniref:Uncharacterized protein n=1 Tax=Paractinoplanes hotanensis TaxID=2906497 RepID=A0ABT0Y4D8_9ACTN|nr:hypothetical protein [Actinoplanes hotanensis]MCM4080715.1 hypothetical protein [Actinoplanes hotanensis]